MYNDLIEYMNKQYNLVSYILYIIIQLVIINIYKYKIVVLGQILSGS